MGGGGGEGAQRHPQHRQAGNLPVLEMYGARSPQQNGRNTPALQLLSYNQSLDRQLHISPRFLNTNAAMSTKVLSD